MNRKVAQLQTEWKTERSTVDTCDAIKRSNVRVIGVPEGERREKEAEKKKKIQEMKTENFPQTTEGINPEILSLCFQPNAVPQVPVNVEHE